MTPTTKSVTLARPVHAAAWDTVENLEAVGDPALLESAASEEPLVHKVHLVSAAWTVATAKSDHRAQWVLSVSKATQAHKVPLENAGILVCLERLARTAERGDQDSVVAWANQDRRVLTADQASRVSQAKLGLLVHAVNLAIPARTAPLESLVRTQTV